ncbi:hypothetical protein JTE90_024886 [Oedothorax gibbosus]|uniref:Uncharacterized protein n=1 Tax=Oedothorax gibbosus TaxID=931172 RepID=A0AAV6V4E1_9ARAC|nr:hypothetical protein JTE90_024886 [Oedothorax gibbosus]
MDSVYLKRGRKASRTEEVEEETSSSPPVRSLLILYPFRGRCPRKKISCLTRSGSHFGIILSSLVFVGLWKIHRSLV